jgi:hypothetical protein
LGGKDKGATPHNKRKQKQLFSFKNSIKKPNSIINNTFKKIAVSLAS